MALDPYRNAARVYDRLIEPMNAPLRRIARGLYPPRPGSVVLDVGCGTGTALAEFRDAGCRVVGVDASPAMLSLARERLGAEAQLHLSLGTSLPVPSRTVDLVHLCLVLHALAAPEAQELLRESRRVLRPGAGVMVIDFTTGGAHFPRGWVNRAVQTSAELAAGPTHARHSWAYRRAGGVEELADRAGLRLRAGKRVAGGTMQISLLRPREAEPD